MVLYLDAGILESHEEPRAGYSVPSPTIEPGHLLNKIHKYRPLSTSSVSGCEIQAERFRLITCCKLFPTEGQTLAIETAKRTIIYYLFNFLLAMDRNFLRTEWYFCNDHWCRNNSKTNCRNLSSA